jgi:methyltransferase-like protein
VDQAREILRSVTSLAQNLADEPYRLLLDHENMILNGRSDPYLYHEYLGEHFEPLYFSDFVRRAWAHGLEYLGEPALSSMATARGGVMERELSAFTRDRIELEQWMDFCTNRAYRATLLHRRGRQPNTDLRCTTVWPMFIASGARPTTPVDLTQASVTTFRNEAGDEIDVSLPLLKAALLNLAEHWRAAIPFEELLDSAAKRLGLAVTEVQRTIFGRAILTALTYSRAIEVSVEPSRFNVRPGEYPAAARDMRLQAELGGLVTNRRHELVELSSIQQKILCALDGSRTTSGVATHTGIPLEEVRREVERLARLALLPC